MLKSEMQHQFWITKKTVQRKLGTKEDKCVVSSDAELDAKIEVFKSISETSCELSKIIDRYQENLCLLSQEECVFGRFLKETGKRSKTTGASISSTGKAVSYSGQQRMCVRVPILRLQHEVEVYKERAIRDTLDTIQKMEKDRTEYRAALAWMKAASSELDPDTGRGLEKFRTAQTVVRNAKHNFDVSSLKSIQKIDLLAAARCNMFSQSLATYMKELKEFGKKTANTYETISRSLEQKPKYDFTVLKELTQQEEKLKEIRNMPNKENVTQDASSTNIAQHNLLSIEKKFVIDKNDKYQCLFFSDDFKDKLEEDQPLENVKDKEKETLAADKSAAEVAQTQNEHIIILTEAQEDGLLIAANNNNKKEENAGENSKLMQECSSWWSQAENTNKMNDAVATTNLLSKQPATTTEATKSQKSSTKQPNKNAKASKYNAWLEIFAEIDPLANPDVFDLKLNGNSKTVQQA